MDELVKVLGSELYTKVMEKLNGKKVIMDDGKLIPKHRFDCINLSLKEHKEQVTLLVKKVDVLTKQCQKLETAEKLVEKLEKEMLIITELTRHKVKNYQTVLPLLNLDGLSKTAIKESLDKQIRFLKKTDSYLFADGNELYKIVPYIRNK